MSAATTHTPDSTTDARPAPRPSPPSTHWIYRFMRWVGIYSGYETIPVMAAALAYRTIFSLIPLLILALLTLRLFQGNDESLVRTVLRRLMDQLGLAQLSDPSNTSFNAEAWITQLVENFKGINFTGIGLVSAAMLIYAGVSLLMEMENCFNRVFGAARARPIVGRLMQYWVVITLGPLFVYASFFVGDLFRNLATGLLEHAGSAGASLVGAAGYAVTVLISAALLLILYISVPNTRVRFSSAALGALSAGAGLELAKYGFQFYAAGAGLKTMYGALALLPLFLLWMYLTWVIVLSGLRIAYIIQHGGRGGAILQAVGLASADNPLAATPCIDPLSLVNVATLAARAFNKGQSVGPERIARDAALPTAVALAMLVRLEEAGVLVRVSDAANPDATHPEASLRSRFTLARPASSILAADLLDESHALTALSDGTAPTAAIAAIATTAPESPAPNSTRTQSALLRARQAQRAALVGLTLEDLAGPTPHANPHHTPHAATAPAASTAITQPAS